MKLKILKKETFNTFVKTHPQKSHFLQSATWGELSKTTRHLTPYYLGLVDDKEKIVAATLLLKKKLPLGLCYLYAPRGYVIDFTNEVLLKELSQQLSKFAKKEKAIYIKIDPDIVWQRQLSDGTVIEEEKKNKKIYQSLLNLGYKHLGFNQNFERSQPRYTFRLDLSPSIEEITNNFHSTTKKIINKGNPYDLTIIKNDPETMNDFFETMCQTAEREDLVNHSFEYYKTYYETFHKQNMSDLYVVTADVEKLKTIYTEKIESIENNIDKLSDEKYKKNEKNANKLQELINQLTKAKKEYNIIIQINQKTIVLSAILTAKFANKVWTLYGGNNTLLRELNANYLIYYEIIKDAKKEHYELIDFFGTTGNPVKENPVYGIHLFKKRLGGDYIEFIGEFDLVMKPFYYFTFTKLVPLYRHIIKWRKKKEFKNEIEKTK